MLECGQHQTHKINCLEKNFEGLSIFQHQKRQKNSLDFITESPRLSYTTTMHYIRSGSP